MAAPKTRTRKQKDPFEDMRPKQADVPVGDSILSIRTATLEQEGQLMALLTDLDLGALLGPLAEILSINVGNENTPNSSVISVLPKIGELGPELWSAAQRILGSQFIPAMRGSATVLLDTRANKKTLMAAEFIDEESPNDITDEGLFIGCPNLRLWVAENLTLLQATLIIKRAFEINGYLEAMGNLMPLTMPAAVVQGMETQP